MRTSRTVQSDRLALEPPAFRPPSLAPSGLDTSEDADKPRADPEASDGAITSVTHRKPVVRVGQAVGAVVAGLSAALLFLHFWNGPFGVGEVPPLLMLSSADNAPKVFDSPLHYYSSWILEELTFLGVAAPRVFTLLTYVAASLTATIFFRKVGLVNNTATVLAVLFALSPYHFVQGGALVTYWPIPLGGWLAIAAMRNESLWIRSGESWPIRVLPGARTALVLVAVAASGLPLLLAVTLVLGCAAVIAHLRNPAGSVRRRSANVIGVGTAVALLPIMGWLLAHTTAERIYGGGASETIGENSFKPLALVLPVQGHPLPAFAALRTKYDLGFDFQSGHVALGTVASIGFIGLMVFPLAQATTSRRPRRHAALGELAIQTWIVFLLGSFGTAAVLDVAARDVVGYPEPWHRLAVLLLLFGLAAVGLVVDGTLDCLRQSRGRHSKRGRRQPDLPSSHGLHQSGSRE